MHGLLKKQYLDLAIGSRYLLRIVLEAKVLQKDWSLPNALQYVRWVDEVIRSFVAGTTSPNAVQKGQYTVEPCQRQA